MASGTFHCGACGGCPGCATQQRLGRRRFLELLSAGAALALAGCTAESQAAANRHRRPAEAAAPQAPEAPIEPDGSAGPPLVLGDIPPPRPGASRMVWSGPPGTRQVALTIDDGYCGECIAGYVQFAKSSGIHITFNPNGVFGDLWTPSLVAEVRTMVADRQVQFGNHTWDHANLLELSDHAVATELTRNDEWIQATFGVTSRPYYRPPYGYYDERVNAVAADLGFTTVLMWNGTLGDATVETPHQLIGMADLWIQPTNIVLGHLNHPTVLSLFTVIQAIIADRHLEPVTLDEMFGTSRTVG